MGASQTCALSGPVAGGGAQGVRGLLVGAQPVGGVEVAQGGQVAQAFLGGPGLGGDIEVGARRGAGQGGEGRREASRRAWVASTSVARGRASTAVRESRSERAASRI